MSLFILLSHKVHAHLTHKLCLACSRMTLKVAEISSLPHSQLMSNSFICQWQIFINKIGNQNFQYWWEFSSIKAAISTFSKHFTEWKQEYKFSAMMKMSMKVSQQWKIFNDDENFNEWKSAIKNFCEEENFNKQKYQSKFQLWYKF